MNRWLLRQALVGMERGWLPDAVIRWGIRRLCTARLREAHVNDCEKQQQELQAFIEEMRRGPVAPVPHQANAQHYEVPAAFYEHVLGRHRKYSSCLWPVGVTTLDDAEEVALSVTCERADLQDGQQILELGCGWGSLSLWMAEHFPKSRIVGVSNSVSQRRSIEETAARRGLKNLQIITADMNRFETDQRFDRVVSVEMFEHMRNYEELLRRIAGWLQPAGKLFIHIFCHRLAAYAYETEGEGNWLGRHFFTGGIMPSDHLLYSFAHDLQIEQHWRWGGTHYQKTAEAWLANLDRNRAAVLPVLRQTYGDSDAERWYHRWRVFFLACAELFGYRAGQEWWVSHYRLRPVR